MANELRKEEIATYVLNSYLESMDFNGVSSRAIALKFGLDAENLENFLTDLIREKKICLVCGDIHPNPHIKAFSDEPILNQLEKMKDFLFQACVYPAKDYPQNLVSAEQYIGKPYNYELALGAGQLEYRVFDLSVLEIYRNDPRYIYNNSDINGNICISDEHYQSVEMAEHDQILLQTFGFCYDDSMRRAVAVFLRYLKDLSPEHQQIWKSKEINKKYFLHPDYYRSSICGQFPEKLSLSDAFVLELKTINDMCVAIGKPGLFRETFNDNKPRGFSLLVRPTLNEFNSFVQILDRMMADNINKDFFKDDLVLENEEIRTDGKIIVSQKSTILLLEEWFKTFFETGDDGAIGEMASGFREVRKLRQKPAHTITPDKFEQKYFQEQIKIFKKAYNSMRIIRLIFANHPDVKRADIEINRHLFEGKIWSF